MIKLNTWTSIDFSQTRDRRIASFNWNLFFECPEIIDDEREIISRRCEFNMMLNQNEMTCEFCVNKIAIELICWQIIAIRAHEKVLMVDFDNTTE